MAESNAPSRSDSIASLDEHRERIHRQMLSSVSHDLKTPLASIIGSLEVYERLKDKLPEERKRALLHVALQEAYRLDSFVTNILDMAKFENAAVKVRKEDTDVRSLIENCVTRLSHRLQDCKLQVEEIREPVFVTTDSTLLCRALGLIIDNAVKYGGKDPEIRIRYGVDNEKVFIEVKDNGQGIGTERQEAIFSKYTRFSGQDSQAAGTGLGLAICREIMRLLGGMVTVANHPQGGAVFTLAFPLA
jgi:K+-sensing histidine kinase KdpD